MHFRNSSMRNNELLNKDQYVVSEQAPISILDIKSAIWISKDGNESKYTRHIHIRMHLMRNGEECNFHKSLWCEGGLKLSDIRTKNVGEDEFNLRLGYDMAIIDNGKNIFQRGVKRYRIFWITMCYEWIY